MASSAPDSAAEEGYDPAWLELEAAMGGRKHLEGSYADKRAQFDGMAAGLQQLWPPVEGVEVENITIPGPADSNTTDLPLRIYKPTTTAAPGATLPTVVWYHGGGWTCGTLDSEDAQCRLIAHRTPCLIISVGYTLLPSNTTAGLLADCLAGLSWARTHAPTHSGDPSRLVVLGGSAGAALALSTAHRLARLGRAAELAGAVALYPVAVHALRPPGRYAALHTSFAELETTAPVVRGADQLGALALAERLAPAADPLMAVAFAYDDEALAMFPRTYVATAGKDLMRDDGVVLERALADGGVEVRRVHYEGLPHYFWFFPQLERTEGFLADVVEGVRWVLRDGEKGGLVVRGIRGGE